MDVTTMCPPGMLSITVPCNMLQVHRIPIVDASAKLVGIVTRTDIFTALGQEASPDVKSALT